VRLAAALVRCWVWIYTAPLPPRIRHERRAEIESDLWEESRSGTDEGSPRLVIALSIVSRWSCGVIADVTWMLEQGARVRWPWLAGWTHGPAHVGEARRRLLVLGVGIGLALVLVTSIVVINTVQYHEGTQPTGEAAVTLVALAIAMAVLGIVLAARGLRIMPSRPVEGALLAVGGSSVAGLAWYWLFLPVLLSAAVSVYCLARAARLHRPLNGAQEGR
jgi:hypothetical protein